VTLRRKLREAWAASKWAAALTVLLGLLALLLRTPEETLFERWSYDLPYLVRPAVDITNVVVVYMDDYTHGIREQPYNGPWDRSLHAKLMDVLTASGCRAVAFDVLFDTEGTNPAASAALARALAAHGHVVLAADLGTGDYYSTASQIRPVPPRPLFLAATPNWGFQQLWPDADGAIRQHFHGSEDVPSLSWKLASMLGSEATKAPNSQRRYRWLNYYGTHGTIRGISYDRAVEGSDPAVRELFRDNIVFVGSGT